MLNQWTLLRSIWLQQPDLSGLTGCHVQEGRQTVEPFHRTGALRSIWLQQPDLSGLTGCHVQEGRQTVEPFHRTGAHQFGKRDGAKKGQQTPSSDDYEPAIDWS